MYAMLNDRENSLRNAERIALGVVGMGEWWLAWMYGDANDE